MEGSDARDLNDRDLDFISRHYFVSFASFASFVVTPLINSFFCPQLFCVCAVSLGEMFWVALVPSTSDIPVHFVDSFALQRRFGTLRISAPPTCNNAV